MKRTLFALCLILCSVLFIMSISILATTHKFSTNTVMNDIKYISSDNFKGRLPGTFENEEVAAYIKGEFQKDGLKPLNGSYYETFNVKCPVKISGDPYLKVYNSKGTLVKEYTYGTDYKEDLINFRKNTIEFIKKDISSISDSKIIVSKSSDSFIFYAPSNGTLSFRSSFMNEASGAMYVMLTQETLSDITRYINLGCTVSCFIPYEIKDCAIKNVVGVLEGKNTTLAPLVVSAHFDHVGTDLSGKIYNGALDNASGTAFMLELAKYVHSLGKPERTIIFAAFNAEEFGFLGSKYFVTSNTALLKGAEAVNFDMIGGKSSIPLCIMGGKSDSPSVPYIHDLAALCSSKHINYSFLFEDASDHESFRASKINAVTFCDNDMSVIHTPNDKADKINTSSIDRCYNVIKPDIIKHAYGNNIFLIYYRETLVVAGLGVVLFSSLLGAEIKQKNKKPA